MELVEVVVTDFGPVAPWRDPAPVEDLREFCDKLVDTVGSDKRVAVVGGAVVRALLGQPRNGHDYDLFVPRGAEVEVKEALLGAGGRFAMDEDDPSAVARARLVFDGRRVDIVVGDSAADTIARFDLRCSAVATNGRAMMSVSYALDDLRLRRLVPLRAVTEARFRKYLGLGLDPRGEEWGLQRHCDVGKVLAEGHRYVVLDDSDLARARTREQALGLDVELQVRVYDQRRPGDET